MQDADHLSGTADSVVSLGVTPTPLGKIGGHGDIGPVQAPANPVRALTDPCRASSSVARQPRAARERNRPWGGRRAAGGVRAARYNPCMAVQPESRRTFSLDEAARLLPTVKLATAEAVREAESIARELRRYSDADPRHRELSDRLGGVVTRWSARIQELELEPKGLWLVDFDNGEGYYCWQYPEESVAHFHGYDEGFAGRMKIV